MVSSSLSSLSLSLLSFSLGCVSLLVDPFPFICVLLMKHTILPEGIHDEVIYIKQCEGYFIIHYSNVKAIQKLTETELKLNAGSKSSWHDMYSGSAYIFVGRYISFSSNSCHDVVLRWIRLWSD